MTSKMNAIRFKTLYESLDRALAVTERIIDNTPQESDDAALARDFGSKLDEMMIVLGDLLRETEEVP